MRRRHNRLHGGNYEYQAWTPHPNEAIETNLQDSMIYGQFLSMGTLLILQDQSPEKHPLRVLDASEGFPSLSDEPSHLAFDHIHRLLVLMCFGKGSVCLGAHFPRLAGRFFLLGPGSSRTVCHSLSPLGSAPLPSPLPCPSFLIL